MFAKSSLLFTLLPLALAKDIPISVGDGGLKFNPDSVTAAVGDTLSFTYFPKNHSVVQSSFQLPCNPLAGGFSSGFNPTAMGPAPKKFVVTVQDTKPIWVYCAQTVGRHCQNGMNMVVNVPAPPSPNTLDAYRKTAAAQTGNSTIGSGVTGGTFVALNSNTTSTSSNRTTGASSTASVSTGASSTSVIGGCSAPYPYRFTTTVTVSRSSSTAAPSSSSSSSSSSPSSSSSKGSGANGSGAGGSTSGSGSSGSASSSRSSTTASAAGPSSTLATFKGAASNGKAISSALAVVGAVAVAVAMS